MRHVLRYSAAVACLALITFQFWRSAAYQPDPISIVRAMFAIGAPIVVIVAGWFVVWIGRSSHRRFEKGEPSTGRVLALATALASAGLIMLVLSVAHMIDRNLGDHHERGLLDVNIGCIIRLAFAVDVLLLLIAAGQGVVSIGILSGEQFSQRQFFPGVILATLTFLASVATAALGCVLAICLFLTLFYRQ